MIKRLVAVGIFLVFFALLSFAESKLYLASHTGQTPAPPQVIFTSLPSEATLGDRLDLAWQVTSPTSQEISSTTVFYSPTASPSALTTSDSPAAVGYPNSFPDYQNGSFYIPDYFEVSLVPTKAGPLFVRAYAFINGQHYWTQEHQIKVK